jgi:tetratricopeptide (TPR) repeat protein
VLKNKLEIYESSPNHPDIAASYNHLGVLCINQKKYAKAVFYFAEAKSIYTEVYKDNLSHPDLFKTIINFVTAAQQNKIQISNIYKYYSSEKYFDFLLNYLQQGISLTSEQLQGVKEAYDFYCALDVPDKSPFEDFFTLYPYEDNPDFFKDDIS